jgi:hypothetical protein
MLEGKVKVLLAILDVARALSLTQEETEVLTAVCYVESHLRPINKVMDSKTYSYGPCQTKAIAARQVNVLEDLLVDDPINTSPLVAALYLRHKRELCTKAGWKAKNDLLKCTLKAYNAGSVPKTSDALEGRYVEKVFKALRMINHKFN